MIHRNLAFLGPESNWAAEAADCAAEQDRFWEYAERLYVEQPGRRQGAFSLESLKRYGAELGLDTTAFNSCVASGRYAVAVKTETEQGKQSGISATPTLVVNGRRIQGVPTFEQLRQVIETVASASGA